MRIFIDQYNGVHVARTVAELRAKLGGRLSKMYIDKKDGTARHIGYVVGSHWCEEFARVERVAS